MISQNFLIKGIYSHPQLHGYFTVKQYIMLEREDKHCLLIRFENELRADICEIAFTVKQLNAAGKVIGRIKIHYSDLNIRAGQLYCPEQGIVIDDACVDCVIDMKYVVSETVKYVFKKGLVTDHYDPRGYKKPVAHKSETSKITVRRQYMGGGKSFRWIALLSFLMAIVMLGMLIYRLQGNVHGKLLHHDHGIDWIQTI